MFYTDSDLDKLVKKINEELKIVMIWLNANKLSLNIEKTHLMLFSPKGKHPIDVRIYINEQFIDKVSHTKFLGVILDDQLNWVNHIKYIRNKVAKSIGIILKDRKVFNSATLLTLYSAVLHSSMRRYICVILARTYYMTTEYGTYTIVGSLTDTLCLINCVKC